MLLYKLTIFPIALTISASHVMMSVIKLLSRIVAPTEIDCDTDDEAATLHDHTFGITSDPLTQFACALGALLHDVDHSGK